MKRDIRIDALRALAILLIMFAHTRPPQWLYELRDFDVVLMTFILGCFLLFKSRAKESKALSALFKRTIYAFNRACMDVFIFIFSSAIYFCHND